MMTPDELLRRSLKVLSATLRIGFGYVQHHPWTIVVALSGLARACGVTIQSGQRGVLFRWGRAVKELEPGFHWLVPVIHGVKKTPVRSVTIDLPDQKVMTADGLLYDVGVNVVYRVTDATRALTLVDNVDSGCRTAIPLVVTEILRVRDQAQLIDRVSLDRELSDRIHAWIARWGLVVEQAGFTTIAPNRRVLGTTQFRSRTRERAGALRALIGAGLDAESALVMLGTERRTVAKSARRYHPLARKSGRPTGPGQWKKSAPAAPAAAKPGNAETPAV